MIFFSVLFVIPFLIEDIPFETELLSLRMELTLGVLCDLFICGPAVGDGFFTFNSVDFVIGSSLVFFSSLFLDNLPALSSAADINSKTKCLDIIT